MTYAKGTFEVKLIPTNHAPEPSIASLSLAKQYHGDLEGTATGEMLSSGDPKSGNAGYVAIEHIVGTLAGHAGSFAIMQLGSMSTGTEPQLTALIVPGSGAGALTGIKGTVLIEIKDGGHNYTVSYTLPMSH